MLEFPTEVKNRATKRLADESVKQFDTAEFNIACKEVALGRVIVANAPSFTIYEAEYRGTPVAVKVVPADDSRISPEIINLVVDLTALAVFPHENIAAFYGAGCMINVETKQKQVKCAIIFYSLKGIVCILLQHNHLHSSILFSLIILILCVFGNELLLQVMIVTEPCSKGTLRQCLKSSLLVDWQLKVELARDIARAMAYLHDQHMIHRYKYVFLVYLCL